MTERTRVLVAASGGEGHLGPLMPFAAAAARDDHEVMVVVPPDQEETVRNAALAYRLTPGVPIAVVQEIRDAMAAGTADDRVRLAEVDLFGRACTDAALSTMERAAESFRPDLILREPCDYASAITAQRHRIPMAQVAISPGRADWNGLHLAAEVIEALEPGTTETIERSPYLSRFPDIDMSFVDTRPYGFALDLAERQRQDPPLVWVTFGTVNSSFDALHSTWDTVLTAVADLSIQVIASTGRTGPILNAPSNVKVVEWVELRDILPRASAVICHGGSGTTLAALSAGIPQVVVPLIADQPTNAAMVEALGAGIHLRPQQTQQGCLQGLEREDVARLQDAISAVLEDNTYGRAAEAAARRLAQRPTVVEAVRSFVSTRP